MSTKNTDILWKVITEKNPEVRFHPLLSKHYPSTITLICQYRLSLESVPLSLWLYYRPYLHWQYRTVLTCADSPAVIRPCQLIVTPFCTLGRHQCVEWQTHQPINYGELCDTLWKRDADWPPSVYTWRLFQKYQLNTSKYIIFAFYMRYILR